MNKELAKRVLEKACFEFENDADFEKVFNNHVDDGTLTEHTTPNGITFIWFLEQEKNEQDFSIIGVENTGDVFILTNNVLDLPNNDDWELCDLIEAIEKKYSTK